MGLNIQFFQIISWRLSCWLAWRLRRRRFVSCLWRRIFPMVDIQRNFQRTLAWLVLRWSKRNLRFLLTLALLQLTFLFFCQFCIEFQWIYKQYGQCGNPKPGNIRFRFDLGGSWWWLEQGSFQLLWVGRSWRHRRHILSWYPWWKDL